MIDFYELIPRLGQMREVRCPDGLCNAQMHGDQGVVLEVGEDAVTLWMSTGRKKGFPVAVRAGHTAVLSCSQPSG